MARLPSRPRCRTASVPGRPQAADGNRSALAPPSPLAQLLSLRLSPPPAERDHGEGEAERNRVGQHRCHAVDGASQQLVPEDQLTGHVAEDAAPEPDDPGEALDEIRKETAPPD